MPVWNKHDYFKIILNWISGILHVSVNVAPVSSSQICVYLNSGRILLWTALRRWLNLGRRAEKPQPFSVEAQFRMKREEESQTEQGAFGIHSGFLCVDCIAKYQRSERKLRCSCRAAAATALRYFIFHRNRKFTAQTERSRLRFGSSKALIQGYLILCNKSALYVFVFFEAALFGKAKRDSGSLKNWLDLRLQAKDLLPFGFPGWFLSQMLVRRDSKWHRKSMTL